MVVLTSNATRELSEALKRRCLYLALDYPSAEREREIVLSRVPDLAPGLAEQLVRTVRALRALELKKSPSISETLRSEEHTSELQSRQYLVCRLLLEKKKRIDNQPSEAVN